MDRLFAVDIDVAPNGIEIGVEANVKGGANEELGLEFLLELEFGSSDRVTEDRDIIPFADNLRMNKTLVSLKLTNLKPSLRGALILAPALKNHPKLESLAIEECGDGQGHLVHAIGIALASNHRIQTLRLGGKGSEEVGTAFAFGSLINVARYVRHLDIVHNVMDCQAAKSVGMALSRNTTLHTLDLTENSLSDDSVGYLARGLRKNTTVEKLILDFNAFGDQGVACLADMLAVNTGLKELTLFGNHVTGCGAEYLARALTTNETLESLILSFNQIGDRGVVALAEALTVNTTLTTMWFPSNSVGTEGMYAFAERLPKMDGLEQLNVGMLLDDEAIRALKNAVKFNLCLSKLYIEEPIYGEEEAAPEEMDFYLRLNRTGRRVLRNSKVPVGLWPRLLSRALANCSDGGSPDVLYYMLRERPNIADEQTRHMKFM